MYRNEAYVHVVQDITPPIFMIWSSTYCYLIIVASMAMFTAFFYHMISSISTFLLPYIYLSNKEGIKPHQIQSHLKNCTQSM